MYSLKDIETYVVKYRPEGLIIDTEVLILLLVGTYNIDCIETCKFTNKFSKQDLALVQRIISYFKKIIITPHIIAEVSNQSKQEFKGNKMYDYFRSLVNLLKSTTEISSPLNSLLDMDIKVISDFGFTDMAMFEIARNSDNKIAILTNDLRFHSHAFEKIPVIKLSHLNAI